MKLFDVENCNVLHVTFTYLLGVNTEDADQSVLPMAAHTDQQYRVMDKIILRDMLTIRGSRKFCHRMSKFDNCF